MSERIISLTSENIKRLRAVHITPNGSSVEIAGRNGAGKSSVLDSIWYALAGRSVLPDRPIRVSTAIGLSLNPGLKVIFIRNGSLIDDAGIRTLCELAKTHEAQIWIERVGALSGELPGVVIEDGAVTESTIGHTVTPVVSCTCESFLQS